MDKNQICEILSEIAVFLELKGENRFKSLAYSNASRTLETLQEDIGLLIREDRLGDIKGIGAALKEKIEILYTTGKLPYYDELKASIPAGLLECLKIPGLGPKKVKVLWEKLDIDSVGDLRLSCERGQVAKLEGFGEKTQTKILEGIAFLDQFRGQFLHLEALESARPVWDALKACPVVQKVQIAGSLRRGKEIVRDLDFLVSTEKADDVMKLFVSLPDVMKITNQGPTKSSVILQSGIQADVRCVSDEEYPTALMYFTGSKEHNIVLRQRAIDQGMKLNEYGLFRIQKDTEKRVHAKSEEEVYQALKLEFVEPELREDMGEVVAAETGKLPKLIRLKDLQGTFHCHTQASDGSDTVEAMGRAAIERGWKYLGLSDHSKSSFVANGLNEKRLLGQIKEIRALNRQWKDEGLDFQLFAGNEVDILSDGTLDFDDEILAQLDFVVVSIHQGFTHDEAKQTARIIKAMTNPYVTMLGHPTGRLLLSRDAYRVDMHAVIEAAAETRTIIELNCTPSRMEMDWRLWKGALAQGVLCSINPDAHSIPELDQVEQGVGAARKGWMTAKDVLNTRATSEVIALLKRKRS